MIDEKHSIGWHIIGETVKGASHERLDQPNQDAISWYPETDDRLPMIVAVSDGHGSAKYFRSDKGAELAVEAAKNTFLWFQENAASFSTYSRTEIENLLTRSLVVRWRGEVNAHIQSEPFTDNELTSLKAKEGYDALKIIQANPFLAYGATILAVMVTETSIMYLQLGDGEILKVSETGETSKVFLRNKRHFANETTSLCSSDPLRDFQFHLEKISPAATLPALILLSTDGYSDSFSSEQEFLKIGSDMFNMIRSTSLEEVKENIPGWLLEATRDGSGDDITLGMLCRMDAFTEFAPSQLTEHIAQLNLIDYIEGENLEHSDQRGDSHEPMQSSQATIWNTLRGETEEPLDC